MDDPSSASLDPNLVQKIIREAAAQSKPPLPDSPGPHAASPSVATSLDIQEDDVEAPISYLEGHAENLELTLASLSSDRQELNELLQQKRLLGEAQRSGAIHRQSLEKSISVLRRTYEELQSVLDALDAADVMDAEDQSLEVVRTAQVEEDRLLVCPFSASMVQQIPLLRLQAVERAEFDNALVCRPWSKWEDKQVMDAIVAAAQKARTMQLVRDGSFEGDPLEVVRHMTLEEALRFSEDIDDAAKQQYQANVNLDWDMVALRVPTRNIEEIRTRWKRVLRPSVNSTPWTRNERDQLVQLVQPHVAAYIQGPARDQFQRPVPWPAIARDLGTNRTAYACFTQYASWLVQQDQPDTTPEEDAAIKTLFSVFRGAWRLISPHLVNTPNLVVPSAMGSQDAPSRPPTILGKVARNSTFVYRRFRNTLNPALAKGKWSEDEDRALIVAVRELGSDNWAAVAARVFGRNSSQCRERWLRRLKHLVQSSSSSSSTVPSNATDNQAESIVRAQDKKRLLWNEQMEPVLQRYINDDLTPKDGLKWTEIAHLISRETGIAVTDKQVRDRIITYKKRKTRGKDPDAKGPKTKKKASNQVTRRGEPAPEDPSRPDRKRTAENAHTSLQDAKKKPRSEPLSDSRASESP